VRGLEHLFCEERLRELCDCVKTRKNLSSEK